MAKRKVRRTRRRAGILGGGKFVAPMLYGGVRQRLSNFLSRWTSRVPLGNVSDEAGMIAAIWAGKKFLFKRAGIARDALNAGMNIELARVGEAIATGQVGLGGGVTATGASVPVV